MNDQSLNQNDKPVKPCIRCGAVDRYKSGRCRPCAIKFAINWNERNPEKVKEIDRKRHRKNAQKRNAKSKEWRKLNPERAKNNIIKWCEKNKNIMHIYYTKSNHNRRARLKSCNGKVSLDIIDKLLKLQNGRCACCGKKLDGKYHLDHIIPLTLGGTNTDDNVQLLLPKCNLRKGAKHPMDYMREQGRLL